MASTNPKQPPLGTILGHHDDDKRHEQCLKYMIYSFPWILFKVRNHYVDFQSLKIHLLPFLYYAHISKCGQTKHGKGNLAKI